MQFTTPTELETDPELAQAEIKAIECFENLPLTERLAVAAELCRLYTVGRAVWKRFEASYAEGNAAFYGGSVVFTEQMKVLLAAFDELK